MKLGIPVYEGVDLNVAGPREMFNWVAAGEALDTIIISAGGDPVTSVNRVRFEAHKSFNTARDVDVLWVPGGVPDALSRIMSDPNSPYLVYLREMAHRAKWVCSVCEGALLLARAGLLDGHRATTHWAFLKCLQRFSAKEVDLTHPRFVLSGNRLTGGGISSGLDRALKLIALLFSEQVATKVQLIPNIFRSPGPGRYSLTERLHRQLVIRGSSSNVALQGSSSAAGRPSPTGV